MTETFDQRPSTSVTNQDILFPEAFCLWAGSSDAAVKRPFEPDEVRLIEPISTNVTKKIDLWIDAIVTGQHVPRTLMLVGGPGNGKTDAVEGAIKKLEKRLANGSRLSEFFQKKFSQYIDKGVLPRKVVIMEKLGQYDGIALVQDATVPEPIDAGKTSQELLLDDLESIVLNDRSNLIYICCVNRGILAEAIPIAAKSNRPHLVSFLNRISSAVSSNSSPIAAWPLDGYESVAVWPMDLESLVDPSLYKDSTPAEVIFEHIANDSLWENHLECPAKAYCPFAFNHKLISKKSNRSNLLHLLHSYELMSGKRWNFREIFGLISILMIGNTKDYKGETQCVWAKKQVALATNNKIKDSFEASFNLSSKLYMHALFPRWPKFGKLRYNFDRKLKEDSKKLNHERGAVQSFFNSLKNHMQDTSSNLSVLINNSFAELLDPVEYSGNKAFGPDKSPLRISEVEEAFSHSVELGKEKVSRYFVGPEKLLFENLCKAEKYIDDSETFQKSCITIVRTLHNTLKAFACRMFKRSIGVRKGIYKNVEELEDYRLTLSDSLERSRLCRKFTKLINIGNSFEASLVTTFGQPEPTTKRNAVLKTNGITVQADKFSCGDDSMPRQVVPQITVSSFRKKAGKSIPLTFALVSALHSVNKGLLKSSLPEDVFALLDSIKSCVIGEIVHDEELLPYFSITLSNCPEVIKFDDTRGFFIEEYEREGQR